MLEIPVQGTLAAAQVDKALFNQFTLTDEWDQVYESNMTQLYLVSADLEVLKFANTATAKAGDTVTYTVLIRNTGDYPTGMGPAWQATMVDVLRATNGLIPHPPPFALRPFALCRSSFVLRPLSFGLFLLISPLRDVRPRRVCGRRRRCRRRHSMAYFFR